MKAAYYEDYTCIGPAFCKYIVHITLGEKMNT